MTLDSTGPPIPARIIQTGKEIRQPLFNRGVIANLQLLNPEFEYLFLDDPAVDSFVTREFPQYRAVFDGFRFPIQRFDFFRYLAIFRLGGFYFDLDVLLASGLSHLLSTGCVFPFEGLTLSRYLRDEQGMDWELGNYAFGAAPGHPFLEAVIANCVRAQRDPDWVKPMLRGSPKLFSNEFLVLNTTGPGLLSRTYAENPDLARTVTVLFPDDVCDSTCWNRFGDLGIHLMKGTWRDKGGFLRRRVAQYWEAWTMSRLLKESSTLGKTRPHVPTTQPATPGDPEVSTTV